MNIATKSPVMSGSDPFEAIGRDLFHDMGVDGVYGRSGTYEAVVDGLGRLVTRHRPADTEVFRFPPVMSRAQLEKSGYLNSFPNLLGCVSCLHGTEAEIMSAAQRQQTGGDWTTSLAPADLVLSPAACYPVYPIAASRGPVPAGGLVFDVACDCFRHEPSRDLDRLQSFRMREYVCIDTPERIADFRNRWMERATGIADQLGLSYRVDVASDPFFGRTGQMLAINQVEQSLKFELLIPLRSAERPTACMSFNYHRDHFAKTWGLKDAAGVSSHTGCVAFGIDRLAIALFHTHGTKPETWAKPVREALDL